MGKMASRRSLLLRNKWPRPTIVARLGSCLTCVLLLAGTVHALDPEKRVTQYIHTSWRTQDGSLPAGMFSIAQTSDGFLWFLSLPGDVYRFDGVRFLPWRLPAGVSKTPIWKLFADRAGGLWLDSKELAHVKDGVVISHFELKGGGQSFQSISEDPDGSLWLALLGSDAPLCHATDSALKCFGKADGIPISDVHSVLADGNGGFWLGGSSALVHWHGGVSETYPIKALKSNSGEIMALARAKDGSLWVGIKEEGLGLAQLKDGAVKPFVTPTFDGSKLNVTSLMFDRDDNLWVGTDAKGLFRIHGDSVEHYGHTDGLSGDSVWTFFEDREGIVWAGTTSGIDGFRDPRVTTFSAVQGLGKDLAAGILASRDGTIWVANSGSLDRIKNGTVSSIRRSDGLPGDQVAAMLEDRAGNLWVGVDDGLYLFKDGRFRRLPEPNHQPLGMVVGMTEDIEGDIWAECASNPSKLVRIHDFQVREMFPAPQVPAGNKLAPDPQGGIWIVRSKELVLFRNGVVETKVPLTPRSSSLSRQIIVEADGSILAGTENGLAGWRMGKVQSMTTKNGLPCDFVISFIEDKEKRWWLYTRCGVVEFSDSELQRWWANPDAVVQNRVYDAFDGAQPNIGSFLAAASTSDGRVWFSSGVVVQMVDPSELSRKELPAQTYIETLVADRKEFKATPSLKIPPNPRDLQIDYTSPTFSIPQKVNFRYRLDNYDRDWHEAGTRRQAFYTDLPPGKYSFRVMASNSDGVWNDNAAKLEFYVAPAYYQTNWFRALCAVFFMALAWAAYQWRVRQLQHQFDMTLEARVGERTRIARELHDTLLQSFQGLMLRFQTVDEMLPARPMEAKKALEGALDRADQAIIEGRDAIKGMRTSTLMGHDLAKSMTALMTELSEEHAAGNGSSVTSRVRVEGAARTVRPILQDEIYRIARESLRNAFRHAQARNIETEITYSQSVLRLRFRDDGKGIDPGVLKHGGRSGHWGMPGMRERAKQMGAQLEVWSQLGAGTEVELSVPGSIAYEAFRGGAGFRLFGKRTEQNHEHHA